MLLFQSKLQLVRFDIEEAVSLSKRNKCSLWFTWFSEQAALYYNRVPINIGRIKCLRKFNARLGELDLEGLTYIFSLPFVCNVSNFLYFSTFIASLYS